MIPTHFDRSLDIAMTKALSKPRRRKWQSFTDWAKLLDDAKRSGLEPAKDPIVDPLTKPTRLAVEWDGDRYAETQFYTGYTVAIGRVERKS